MTCLPKTSPVIMVDKKKSQNIIHTSSKLRFSISIPSNWKVNSDCLVSDQNNITVENLYKTLVEDTGISGISFQEFKKRYKEELKKELDRENIEAEAIFTEEGHFEASPTDDSDYPSVEVIKLNLYRSIPPIELYQIDKPGSEEVPWGNRPSAGITVDGLKGVKFFYIHDTGKTRYLEEMTKFFRVYLTDGEIGWIIYCSCAAKVFPNYKSKFTNIIKSFKRLN